MTDCLPCHFCKDSWVLGKKILSSIASFSLPRILCHNDFNQYWQAQQQQQHDDSLALHSGFTLGGSTYPSCLSAFVVGLGTITTTHALVSRYVTMRYTKKYNDRRVIEAQATYRQSTSCCAWHAMETTVTTVSPIALSVSFPNAGEPLGKICIFRGILVQTC